MAVLVDVVDRPGGVVEAASAKSVAQAAVFMRWIKTYRRKSLSLGTP